MTLSTYNEALLDMATRSLAELARSAEQKAGKRTPAQESHFLCTWMADSLKEKRFSRLVMEDLKGWIQQGRTLGAGADLKGLLERIVSQYGVALAEPVQLGTKLGDLIDELQGVGWLVLTDTEIAAKSEASSRAKLRLLGQGQSSLVICASEYQGHLVDGELLKPVTLYMRGDERHFAASAVRHGLLLSQGDKKATQVKHHKAYRLVPANAQPALALLAEA